MKYGLFKPLFISLICLILFSSCLKDFEEEIQGVWDVVNVGDMHNQEPCQWHFQDNDLKIFLFNSESPGQPYLQYEGHFVVKNTMNGLILRIGEMSYDTYNDDWQILTLTHDKLIIALQCGDVIYKEFTKKSEN